MITSKLTSRSQTTVPAGVRHTLDVEPGEELGYIIEGDGVVRLVNASQLEAQDDPVIAGFLRFLGRDLVDHPERVAGFPTGLIDHARALTHGLQIDHDVPIDGAVRI